MTYNTHVQKYDPAMTTFAIFMCGEELKIAVQVADNDSLFFRAKSADEPIESVMDFAASTADFDKESLNPEAHFTIPKHVTRRIIVGEQEAVKAYNKILEGVLAARKSYIQTVNSIIASTTVPSPNRDHIMRMVIVDRFGVTGSEIEGRDEFSLNKIIGNMSKDHAEEIMRRLNAGVTNFYGDEDATLVEAITASVLMSYDDFKIPNFQPSEHLGIFLARKTEELA